MEENILASNIYIYIYILTKIISLCNHVVEKYMENKNGNGKGYLVVDEKYK